jgi:transposase-like protein
MDPILDAIAAIDAHEAGDKPSYRQTAKKFGVDRTTLARRQVSREQPHKRLGQRQRKRALRALLKVVVEVVSLHLPYLQSAPKHAVSTSQLDI